MEPGAFLLAAASYVAGGIPTGYWMARATRGIDIREHGSGNPGAANVYRVVGPAAGLATLAVDVLKGFLPVLLAQTLIPAAPAAAWLCAAAAVAGHLWMVFLRFHGGKGVATTAGVCLALAPAPMLPTVLIFLFAGWSSGHISVGSVSGAAAFPILAFAAGAPAGSLLVAAAACAAIFLKHIPNLRRILADAGASRRRPLP